MKGTVPYRFPCILLAAIEEGDHYQGAQRPSQARLGEGDRPQPFRKVTWQRRVDSIQ